MNRIRSALPWRRKNYNGDSDSTGYCSSSEVSKTLSDSQFILRPNTALLSCSYSNSSNYYALDYSEFSDGKNKDASATITSRSSTISTNTFRSQTTAIEGDDEDEEDSVEVADEEEDEASTVRANSVRCVPMMPKLTSLKHMMPKESSNDEMETLDELSTSYDDEDDDEITIDVPIDQPTVSSKFKSFPFSYRFVENEMDRLFGMLQVDDQIPSTSSTVHTRKKRLLIQEPTTKIYYHEKSVSEATPPLRPSVSRTESVPRSILKNSSTFAIYEEIYGDHLTPIPTDIRPELPSGHPIMAFQQFPPCTDLQPRQHQIHRKKKLPSLHHSTSFASYFRKRF